MARRSPQEYRLPAIDGTSQHRTLLAALAQGDINMEVIQPPDRFSQ